MKNIVKVLGPYLARTGKIKGRKYVRIIYDDKSDRQILYSRFLMEQKLDRVLSSNEHVDHIDRNKTNDLIGNLQVIDKVLHCKKDARRVKLILISCIYCGKETQKKARYLDHNAKQGKAGPFCGKSCAGLYGSDVQNGKVNKLKRQPHVINREYFCSGSPTEEASGLGPVQ